MDRIYILGKAKKYESKLENCGFVSPVTIVSSQILLKQVAPLALSLAWDLNWLSVINMFNTNARNGILSKYKGEKSVWRA